MLSQAEIDAMRRAVSESALPKQAQVQRAASSSDGAGGVQQVFAQIATGVPCGLALPNGGTPGLSEIGKVIGDRAGNRVVMVATFAAGTDIQDGDRLVIDGETYEVINGKVSGSWEIARRAMVIKL